MKEKMLRDNFNFSKTIFVEEWIALLPIIFSWKSYLMFLFFLDSEIKRMDFDLKLSDIVAKYSATVKTQRRFTT